MIGLSASQCAAHCDNSTACDCVTYCAEKSGDCYAKGACWRRTDCDEKKFERDDGTKPFEVFVRGSTNHTHTHTCFEPVIELPCQPLSLSKCRVCSV